MSLLPHVDLEVGAHAITATPDDQSGVSSTLTSGAPYFIVGVGNAGVSGGADGNDFDQTFLLGSADGSRTAFARAATERTTFGIDGAAGSEGSGGDKLLAAALLYTPGAGEEMETHAWGPDGAGEAWAYFYAIDVSAIPGPGTGSAQARWHSQDTNSESAESTPASGVTVIASMAFTPARAGDYLVVVEVEVFGDGTQAATDELDLAVEIDDAVVSGSPLQCDHGERSPSTHGYLYAFLAEDLTAAEHIIEITLNGTSSGGNLSERRARIHVFESGIFVGGVQQATDAGETITDGTGPQDVQPAGLALTIGNGSRDYLLMYFGQRQVSYWSEVHFDVGGVELPTNGFAMSAGEDFGLAASDDMTLDTGVAIASAPAASTALALTLTRFDFAGSNNYGGDCARTAGGDLRLLAIPLEVYDRIDGDHAGASAFAGTAVVIGNIEGDVAGASAFAGDATDANAGQISGDVAGASAFAGDLIGLGQLEGDVAGSSALAGDVVGLGQLTGDIAGASAVAADVVGLGQLTTFVDDLRVYDDDFRGSSLSSQWTEYLPAEVAREVVAGGEVNIEPTEGGLAGSHWFDDRDGILRHLVDGITGRFDARLRIRARDSAGTSSPPTAAGEFRFGGLAVHDPDRATQRNYLHGMIGADPNGTDRLEWKSTDDSVSTFDSDPGSAPLDYDIRIRRDPDDLQLFHIDFRRSDAGEELGSDAGWAASQDIDRDDNATPPRASAVNMPATVQIGWSGGYAGPQTAHDIQTWAESFRLRRGIPETLTGESDFAASSAAIGNLSGDVAGASAYAGDVDGVGQIEGDVAGNSLFEGALEQPEGAISGDLAGASTFAGDVVGLGHLAGGIAGGSAFASEVVGAGQIEGDLGGSSLFEGELEPPGAVSGDLPGASVFAADILGVGLVAGDVAGASAFSASTTIDFTAPGTVAHEQASATVEHSGQQHTVSHDV